MGAQDYTDCCNCQQQISMAYSSASESSESKSISSNNWRTESTECLGDCGEGIAPYRFEPTSSRSDVEDGGPGGENDDDDDVGMDTGTLRGRAISEHVEPGGLTPYTGLTGTISIRPMLVLNAWNTLFDWVPGFPESPIAKSGVSFKLLAYSAHPLDSRRSPTYRTSPEQARGATALCIHCAEVRALREA